jgi:branched-chain amino acid transport system permease protein
MLAAQAIETNDQDEVYLRRFEEMQRDYLRTLLTPEVIEEHRRSPQGQHSEALQRLLIYFRRRPQAGKYAITADQQFKVYRIVALSGQRGGPPRAVEDRIYASAAEAHHGVFLRRVQDLLKS